MSDKTILKRFIENTILFLLILGLGAGVCYAQKKNPLAWAKKLYSQEKTAEAVQVLAQFINSSRAIPELSQRVAEVFHLNAKIKYETWNKIVSKNILRDIYSLAPVYSQSETEIAFFEMTEKVQAAVVQKSPEPVSPTQSSVDVSTPPASTSELEPLPPEPKKKKSSYRVSLALSYIRVTPSGSDFKQIYGSGYQMPEFKATVRVIGGFYVWGSFSFTSSSGTVVNEGSLPISGYDEACKLTQKFISFGAGMNIALSKKLELLAEGGMSIDKFQEEALGKIYSSHDSGFLFLGGINFKLGKNMFIRADAGMQLIDDADSPSSGFRMSGGFGFRL